MKVIEAKTQHELFSVINIRKDVFMLEQKVSVEEELDDLDYEALHFLVIDDHNKPIATARLVEFSEHFLLGRIAVLIDNREKGVAKEMIQYIIDNYCNGKAICLGAQEQAIGFYEKLGFKITGDLYYDAGIRHFPMELINSATSKI